MGRAAHELTGKQFGDLLVLRMERQPDGRRAWVCRCVCGGEVRLPANGLTQGNNKSCGCRRSRAVNAMVGQQVGKLTVVERHVSESRCDRTYFSCRCECGAVCVVSQARLANGHTRSCGCIRKGKPQPTKRKSTGESLRNRVVDSYRGNARHKGVEFSLSDAEVHRLLAGDCHYCGVAPCRVLARKTAFGSFTYNGIDRVDNRLGYVSANVVSCCWACNSRKRDADLEEFLAWAKRLAVRQGWVGRPSAEAVG